MKIDKIAVTEGRMNQALENAMSPVIQKQNEVIQKMVDDVKVQLGTITKYYPYLDKAEVLLENSKKVLCNLPHMFMGELIDFFTPSGTETYCENLHEPCIIPLQELHVAVLSSEKGQYFILTYYSPDGIFGISPAKEGNMRLAYISPTNEQYIEFGKNGLNIVSNKQMEQSYGEYEDDLTEVHYATKEDLEEINTDFENTTLRDLLETTEDYKQTVEDKYSLFRGDCWTINNNFESSASVTSETTSDLTITGTFRTKNDMVGLYWNSKDPIQHPYISYGEVTNYTGVVLDFDYEMSGCKDFSDGVVSITIRKTDGSIYYFTMGRFISNGHFHLDFDELVLVSGDTYINSEGESVIVSEDTPVNPENIQSIMLVIIPDVPNYTSNPPYEIMSNVDFTCSIFNITVVNGEIGKEHLPLAPHKYRLCEGYDDFYDFNPYRICKEMRKLGYTEWLDLYIGASHFYEKSGTVGDLITDMGFNHNRTEKMVLDTTKPLNKAFSAWLDCYSRELKKNGTPNLVVSVSMENLQCPKSWRQKQWRGTTRENPEGYALTGWIPSTFFYSPCHPEVAPYMQSVSEACLDIVVANDMQPILQMGEAWWWWNESDKPKQPPCFYDDSTKLKYLAEFGAPIPEYTSAWDDFDDETIYWLNQQICGYSDALREVVKSSKYTDGLYMALFFPPSVLDTDRVPEMMRDVNYLVNAYHPVKLDVLQLEDYDWVTGISPQTKERDRSHHPMVYELGEKLGFPKDRVHYFGGFVQYPEDAREYWRVIKQAMDDAITTGYKEVFVWAGSQVRRDNKIIGYDNYELIQHLLHK